MAKVDSSLILKEGAKLEPVVIDFSDSAVKRFITSRKMRVIRYSQDRSYLRRVIDF